MSCKLRKGYGMNESKTKHKKTMIVLVILIVVLVMATQSMTNHTEGKTIQTKKETVKTEIKILKTKIRRGHSLLKTAKGLGVTKEHLMRLNDIKNSDLIYAGNVLSVIPYTHTDKVEVSWYGKKFHMKLMSNGKPFDMNDPTIVAHKYLPLGTKVRLTYNGKNIIVTVQDRGPYIKGRHFDLSMAGAIKLGFKDKGHVFCKVEIID